MTYNPSEDNLPEVNPTAEEPEVKAVESETQGLTPPSETIQKRRGRPLGSKNQPKLGGDKPTKPRKSKSSKSSSKEEVVLVPTQPITSSTLEQPDSVPVTIKINTQPQPETQIAEQFSVGLDGVESCAARCGTSQF